MKGTKRSGPYVAGLASVLRVPTSLSITTSYVNNYNLTTLPPGPLLTPYQAANCPCGPLGAMHVKTFLTPFRCVEGI